MLDVSRATSPRTKRYPFSWVSRYFVSARVPGLVSLCAARLCALPCRRGALCCRFSLYTVCPSVHAPPTRSPSCNPCPPVNCISVCLTLTHAAQFSVGSRSDGGQHARGHPPFQLEKAETHPPTLSRQGMPPGPARTHPTLLYARMHAQAAAFP